MDYTLTWCYRKLDGDSVNWQVTSDAALPAWPTRFLVNWAMMRYPGIF
jgi:hypothetical protein